jgi:hypothetical protein
METERTANAKVAGILCIVAGLCALVGSFILAGLGVAGFTVLGSTSGEVPHCVPLLPLVLFVPASVLLFTLAVLSILGGVAGVRRQRFWLLVLGAASAILCFLPLGVVALIFAALAEKEFH